MARKGENIFKRSDGRWEGHYIKGHKNGRAVYGFVFGKTYSESKEKKSLVLQNLSVLSTAKPPSVSPIVKDVAERCLAGLIPRCKTSTLVKYRNQLESHIYLALGDMRISEGTNESANKKSSII